VGKGAIAPAPANLDDGAPVSTTVAIVGGGLAGLITAHELRKRGVAFHLLEASDVVGGRVQTAYYDGGLHAEYGLQEVWADNPLYDIMKELGVPVDSEAEPPFSSMVLDGKLYPFVQDTNDAYFASMMTPAEVKQLKDWMTTAKALRATALTTGVASAEIAKLQNMTFAQWIGSFKMNKRVNDWIRLTIECELATSWDIFSAVVGLTEFGVFLGDGEPNYQVLGGNTKLIEALANSAGPRSITKSALVQRVDRKDGKVTVSYIKAGRLHTLAAEQVVVAVPPWRLHQIHFEPPLAKKKWQGITTLMRGSYTVVHMVVNKNHRRLTYVDGESPFAVLTDGVLGVIYGVQSEAPPESPNEVFAFLVHGNAAYSFHMQAREAKIKEMLDAMDKLWPGFSKLVVTSYVYTYHPGAITVWPVGRSPLDDKQLALRTPEDGLSLAGDYLWSGHSDGAGRSAIDVAAAIATDMKTKATTTTP
jgi:monoamine oxidase